MLHLIAVFLNLRQLDFIYLLDGLRERLILFHTTFFIRFETQQTHHFLPKLLDCDLLLANFGHVGDDLVFLLDEHCLLLEKIVELPDVGTTVLEDAACGLCRYVFAGVVNGEVSGDIDVVNLLERDIGQGGGLLGLDFEVFGREDFGLDVSVGTETDGAGISHCGELKLLGHVRI